MSKKSRSLKRAREESSAGTPTVTKVRDPVDLISMVPYLFGFQPEESLVVVSLEGGRRRVGPSFRVDLPEDADDVHEQVGYLYKIAHRHQFAAVVLIAYSADRPRAARVVQPLSVVLRRRGIEVVDAVRADGTRWWSYTCTDAGCCPPEGTVYDADSSPAAADAVYAGMQRAPSRDALREQFTPGDPRLRAAVSAAVGRLRASGARPAGDAAAFDASVATAVGSTEELAADMIAWLAVAVHDNADLRDRACGALTRQTAETHLRLWRQVMRHVPDELVVVTGTIAGFAAWLSGHGVLAAHAVERVLALDPDYRLATLLAGTLQEAVSPQEWEGVPPL